MEKERITLRIPAELKINLESKAKEEDRSLNSIINVVLKEFVNKKSKEEGE